MLVFVVKTICCSKKKFSRDLGSPDSRQLLQLQLSSQIFKILDPPCWFYLAWFYWFPEFGCSFATILDFPEFELSSIVYRFRRMNDYFCLQMLLTVELNIFLTVFEWFGFIAVGGLLNIKSGFYFSVPLLFRRLNKLFQCCPAECLWALNGMFYVHLSLPEVIWTVNRGRSSLRSRCCRS